MIKVYLILTSIMIIILSNCNLGIPYTKKEYMDLWENYAKKSKKYNSSDNDNNIIIIPTNDPTDDPIIPVDPIIPTAEEIINGNPNYIDYGVYKFSSNSTICKKDCKIFSLNNDFVINQPLNSGSYNIYDLNNANSLSTGKYFRVVHNGINAANAGGLNLIPVAKDLNIIQTPPHNQIYIDPIIGKFVLPKPVYWSKCESVSNLVNPEIKNSNETPEFSGQVSVPSNYYIGPIASTMPFNYGIGSAVFVITGNGLVQESCHTLYPFGNVIRYNDSYTISFWHYGILNSNSCQWHNFVGCGNIAINQSNIGSLIQYIKLYINGIENKQYIANNNGSTNHYCILIDKNKNLANGDSVAVYMNGGLILNTSDDIEPNSVISLLSEALHNGDVLAGLAYSIYDNIKIWNEILDPAIIYDMAYTEDALHPIYGAANVFKPSNNLKVGYYK